jgi:GTP-binding protein
VTTDAAATALPSIHVDEPTIALNFLVNNSPFAGREGEFKTSREIRERLFRELETDVALRVEETQGGEWIVSGRGELHLAILIERMRREGYEFQVSRPEALVKVVDGQKLTAYERVFIEVPQDYSGAVIQKMGERKALMQNMVSQENGIVELEFIIATYNLFGYRNEFLTDTKGLGILNTMFEKFDVDKGEHFARLRGSLVAHESGDTKLYGLSGVQDRGTLFVGPGVPVYKGQVIGQNSREGDIRLNVCKEKKLSNMRSKGDGVMEHFNTPRTMSLEDAIEYIDDSELVEITPKNIRIRKTILDEIEARRQEKFGK